MAEITWLSCWSYLCFTPFKLRDSFLSQGLFFPNYLSLPRVITAHIAAYSAFWLCCAEGRPPSSILGTSTAWIHIVLTKSWTYQKWGVRLKFHIQMVAVSKGCWMFCCWDSTQTCLVGHWSSLSITLGEVNNSRICYVSINLILLQLQSCTIGIKTLKIVLWDLLNRLTAKGKVQSKTEPVKTEQNVMSPRQFCSSAFADFSLCLHWLVAPGVHLPQSVLRDFCSPITTALQSYFCHDWLFPICPLFSEGRAKTKLKYLTISGFGGWLSAQVGIAFQWWMKKWNECWAEWLKKAPELPAVVGNVLTNI